MSKANTGLVSWETQFGLPEKTVAPHPLKKFKGRGTRTIERSNATWFTGALPSKRLVWTIALVC
jgi:hypothetical protein